MNATFASTRSAQATSPVMRAAVFATVALVSAQLASSHAWAAWPADGAPMCTAAHPQTNPVVAPDGTGGAFVAWVDHRIDTDVYVQHVLADGTLPAGWPSNGVVLFANPEIQDQVAIVADGFGGVFVAWRDRTDDTGDIRLSRVLGSGAIAWLQSVVALNMQSTPAIVSDGAGGCIVTWRDARVDVAGDIYAQRVSGAGVVLWTPVTGVALCAIAGSQDFPTAVADGSGGAIVVWQDGRSLSGTDVYAQRVSAAGTTLWGTTGVQVSTTQLASNPHVASDGSGGGIFAWNDNSVGAGGLLAQHVSAGGSPTWTAVLLTSALTVSEFDLCSDGAGGGFVAYQDDGGGTRDIRAQRVNSAGALPWGSIGVAVCTAPGDQLNPTIVSDGTGGALVAWTDQRNAGTAPDIYGQRIRPNGVSSLPTDGISLCSAASAQSVPEAAMDGAGGAFVVWPDDRNGATSTDIYAQRFLGAGAPRLEAGFPEALPSLVVSPPAICELGDGDAESEIVLGTADGFVRVFAHDGTPLWAQPIGSFPWHCPIAIEDIDWDQHSEVFCGNRTGIVHGFSFFGAPLSGWPVNLGTNDSAYVSIGNVLGDPRSEVVVCSRNEVFVLRFDGTVAPGFPVFVASEIDASAAIGDVDGDGDNEIVVLESGGSLDVIRGDGTLQAFRAFPGKSFKRSPALGDLNLDGTLEIVAGTTVGDVYVLNPDGTNYPGTWPFHDATGMPISGIALANTRGLLEPEIVFGVDSNLSPRVHAFFQDGTELSGYPRVTASSGSGPSMTAEPIIEPVADSSPDVLIGTPAVQGYAWTNFGVDVPGWPTSLTGPCWVSPATGDIDGDGRVEAVIGSTSLAIFDLGGGIQRSPTIQTRWWPMFGYNPQRQHCLACGRDAVTSVAPHSVGPTVQLGAPYPNPTRGSVNFSLDLPKPGLSRVVVRDLAGRGVRRLLEGWLPVGRHTLVWDGRDDRGSPSSAGIYYATLEVKFAGGTVRMSKAMVLLR